MKPIHILTSDETAAVVAAQLGLCGQGCTWGLVVPPEAKYLVRPLAPVGSAQADRLVSSEIMRAVRNAQEREGSCRTNAFTVELCRPPVVRAPPVVPAPPTAITMASPPGAIRGQPATATDIPAGVTSLPCPQLCIVCAAYGKDPVRIAANRKAMATWGGQTLLPHLVLVELLEPGEASHYADALPVGRSTHVVLPYDPWAMRGLFQKEAAMNLGAKIAPDATEVLLFLDMDVHSADPHWFAEVMVPFAQHPGEGVLVQCYRRMMDTGEPDRNYWSVGSAPAIPLDPKIYRQPGLGWAMRRDYWTRIGGLNPWGVSGSGDVMILHELSPGYYPDWDGSVMAWWQDVRRRGLPQARLAFANVDVIHEHHGPFKERAYWDSRVVIDWLETPVKEMIELGHDGLLRWRNPDCRLAKLFTCKAEIGNLGLKVAAAKVGLLKHSYKDIFGWFDFQGPYRKIVAEAPKGSTLVELGCFFGKSTCFLAVQAHNANKALEVVACDLFPKQHPSSDIWGTGPGQTPFPPSGSCYETCQRNLKATGARVELLAMDGVKLADEFKDGSVFAVWIDADHTYAGTLAMLNAWWPTVAPGGLIGGHDYMNAKWPGVRQAVDEWAGAPSRRLEVTQEGISFVVRKWSTP